MEDIRHKQVLSEEQCWFWRQAAVALHVAMRGETGDLGLGDEEEVGREVEVEEKFEGGWDVMVKDVYGRDDDAGVRRVGVVLDAELEEVTNDPVLVNDKSVVEDTFKLGTEEFEGERVEASDFEIGEEKSKLPVLEAREFEDVALDTFNEVDVDERVVELNLVERVDDRLVEVSDDCTKSLSDAELLDERDETITESISKRG